MKSRIAAANLVALALGFLLTWKRAAVTPGLYRLGFFFGLATFVAWILSPGGQMHIRIGRAPWKRIALVPIGIMMAAPFIVLVEAGFAGYLGFAAFMRYVSLVVAMLGLFGLGYSLVFPYVLRRHSLE